ncbi:hypothetical protein PUN28_007892 [Cardiocondyla obscurior]|uniref:Uncharacterized protein n=1 Tax=Cardiocondyla obscurior TaxID=286306 RepID=A0AAW2FWF0_9HYME
MTDLTANRCRRRTAVLLHWSSIRRSIISRLLEEHRVNVARLSVQLSASEVSSMSFLTPLGIRIVPARAVEDNPSGNLRSFTSVSAHVRHIKISIRLKYLPASRAIPSKPINNRCISRAR